MHRYVGLQRILRFVVLRDSFAGKRIDFLRTVRIFLMFPIFRFEPIPHAHTTYSTLHGVIHKRCRGFIGPFATLSKERSSSLAIFVQLGRNIGSPCAKTVTTFIKCDRNRILSGRNFVQLGRNSPALKTVTCTPSF